MLLGKYPGNDFSLHICHPSEILYKFLMPAERVGDGSGKKASDIGFSQRSQVLEKGWGETKMIILSFCGGGSKTVAQFSLAASLYKNPFSHRNLKCPHECVQ